MDRLMPNSAARDSSSCAVAFVSRDGYQRSSSSSDSGGRFGTPPWGEDIEISALTARATARGARSLARVLITSSSGETAFEADTRPIMTRDPLPHFTDSWRSGATRFTNFRNARMSDFAAAQY